MSDFRLFSVYAASQEEWNTIYNWGIENKFMPYLYTSLDIFGECDFLSFYNKKDMVAGSRSPLSPDLLTFEEFKQKYMEKKETFEVDKEFILEAYKSACPNWKQKIKDKFPNVFENIFIGAKPGDRFKHEDGDKYIFSRITSNTYCLVDLGNGNRYSDPVENPRDVTLYPEEFIKIKK